MEVKILERRRLWKMSRTKRRKIVFYIRLCTVKYRKIKASNVQRTHVFAPVNTSTTDLFYFCHSCFSCITSRAVILRFYVTIFFFFFQFLLHLQFEEELCVSKLRAQKKDERKFPGDKINFSIAEKLENISTNLLRLSNGGKANWIEKYEWRVKNTKYTEYYVFFFHLYHFLLVSIWRLNDSINIRISRSK